MAVSLDTQSPSHLNKKLNISMDSSSSSSSPQLSPSSEKQFWGALRNRVDTLLENRQLKHSKEGPLPSNSDLPQQAPSLREDCLLLLRGFDSISSSFSQLTSNLETALQGARDLSKTSFTELVHSDSNNPESKEREDEEAEEGNRRAVKRKCDSDKSCEDQGVLEQKDEQSSPRNGKLKKARNLAVSMATNAASLARELKSIKSDLCFMQDRCTLLEEENRRLREGCEKEISHEEEDDLVRLQMEALLAEKSRLANQNANLTRENRSLQQLVEYHQLTSQDVWEDYEQVIEGMCLDFSSPKSANEAYDSELEAPRTPRTDLFGFSTSLDQCSEEHLQQVVLYP